MMNANDNPAPTWRGRPIPLSRAAIEAEIERLIWLLDVADGDSDLEEDEREDEGHDEPSLGWTLTGAHGWGENEEEFDPAEHGIGDKDGLYEQVGGIL